jgi:tellurite resistance protein
MPNRNTRNRSRVTHAEIVAAYMDDRDSELLDAGITAAALVARADGWIEPAERRQLLDFLRRNGLLSVFSRAEILDTFERRIRELQEKRGAEMAVGSLGRLAGRSPARLVIDAGQEIAAADQHLDPREQHILQLIRITLRGPLAPSALRPDRAGRIS